MSLTSELDRQDSPVRRFLLEAIALVSDAKRGSSHEQRAKALLESDALPREPSLVPVPRANPSTVGTAFDYRLRYDMSPFSSFNTVAAASLNVLGTGDQTLRSTITDFLEATDTLVVNLGPDQRNLTRGEDRQLIRHCVVLAQLESIVRSGGRYQHLSPLRPDLLDGAPESVVTDVAALHAPALVNFGPRRQLIQQQALAYWANPTFAGSAGIGGADADMIVGNEIIELKTTKALDPKALRSALTQLVGYCLLDYPDQFQLRAVGVYFARHRWTRTWPLWMFLFPTREVLDRVDHDNPPAEQVVAKRLAELRSQMRAAVDTPRT